MRASSLKSHSNEKLERLKEAIDPKVPFETLIDQVDYAIEYEVARSAPS